MPWWGYALAALVFWGLWGFFSKMAAKDLSAWAIFLYEIPVYVVLAGVILWGWRPELAAPRGGVGMAALAGLCGGLGLVCFLQALTAKPAAVVVPLTSLYPVLTALLGVVILREQLTLWQWLGIGLAVIAVWLLTE